MHKKRINGREYYYTSYRDKNGKVRTKYLGKNRREAVKRLNGRGLHLYLLVFGLITFGLLCFGIFGYFVSYSSFAVLNDGKNITLDILNKHANPVVGGNWTVQFTTNGTADLEVQALNGTEFGKDLTFVRLLCGKEELQKVRSNGNKFVYKKYNCDNTGYFVSRVLSAGKHSLQFNFGEAEEKGYNEALANVSSCGTITQSSQLTVNISTIGPAASLSAGCFNFTASNILFDCNGYTIDGIGNTSTVYGINISLANNITIKNCYIQNFSYGVHAKTSNDTLVYNNTFTSILQAGIYVNTRALRANITSNIFEGNGVTLSVAGISFYDSSNINYDAVIFGNNISNIAGGGTDPAPGIKIVRPLNITIKKNVLVKNDAGIHLGSSSGNHLIEWNNISLGVIARVGGVGGGITLTSGGNNNIILNNIIDSNAGAGIFISVSDDNLIANNTIISQTGGSYGGIEIGPSSDRGIITDNNITANSRAIYIAGTSTTNFNITNNTILANTWALFNTSLYSYSGYKIWRNNFMNRTNAVRTGGRDLILFNSSEIGNFWLSNTNCIDDNFNNYCDGNYSTASGAASINETDYQPYSAAFSFHWFTGAVAPIVSSVSISPATPNENENLNCTVIVTNERTAEAISVNVSWFKGNVFQFAYNASVTNGTATIFTLDAANTTINDAWLCSARPRDGGDLGSLYGTPVNSSSVTIVAANVAPTASTPTLTPASPTTSDNLNCTFNVTDPNADSLSANISWFRDNVFRFAYNISVTNGTLVSNYLDSPNTTKGNSWLCSVKPYDGTDYGTPVNSSSLTILNTAPSKPNLVSPANNSRTTGNSVTLQCSGSTDADADTIYYELWNGTASLQTNLLQNSTSTSYSWSTADGIRYYWWCKSHDNSSSSAFNGSYTFLENTAPSITSANLSNSNANNYTNGTLTATYGFTDAEGDSASITETKWFINNILNTTFANTTSISAGNTTKGESWIVSIRVYDGYEWSGWLNSSSSAINNAPPSAPTSISITGTTFGGTDNIIAISVSGADDIDADAIRYNIESYYNSAWSLIAANDTDGSYSWDVSGISTQSDVQFRSFANDGTANSQTYTSASTYNIDNSAPSTTSNFTSTSWQDHNINITLSCTDTGAAGCSARIYCIDTSNSCNPNQIYTSEIAVIDEATNYLRFHSNDTVNNTEAINSQIVRIDKTKPVPSFIAPTLTNGTYINSNSITANISTLETNFANLTFRLFDSSQSLLNTTISTEQNASVIWSGLSDGLYYYNATVKDLAVNVNGTEMRAVIIDTTMPLVDFNGTTPENNKYVNFNDINIAVSVTETNPSNETFSLNNVDNNPLYSNITALQYWFKWTALAEGTYYYNISIRDKANNRNLTSQRNITLDRTNPVLAYNASTLSDGQFVNIGSILIGLSITETNRGNETFYLMHSNASLLYSNLTSASNLWFNWSNLADGSYLINATHTDKANNRNTTLENRNITIDRTSPLIDYGAVTPDINTFTNKTSLFVNTSVTELNFANITFYLYNITALYNQTTNTQATYNINFTGLPDTTYNFNITIKDKASNQNFTSIRNITIDTIAPTINISHIISSANANFSLNLTTNEFTTCHIRNETISTSAYGLMNITNSTSHRGNLSLGVGDYEYSLQCIDKAQNSQIDTTPFTIVATGTPVITNMSIYPSAGSVNTTKWNITITSTGSGRLATAEYNSNPTASTTGLLEQRLSYYLALATVKNVSANLSNLNVKYYYTDSEISGIDEATLRIFFYNYTAESWQAAESTNVDTANNYVWANLTHFSIFAVSGAVEGVPTGAPSVGGGGAGGIGSFTTAKGFYTDKKQLSYVLTPKEFFSDYITITSTSSQTQTISLRLVNLKHMITLSEEQFDLAPDEVRRIKLDVITGDSPDIYYGTLYITSDEEEIQIPITIEVETAKVLFDVRLAIPEDQRTIYQGTDSITTDISLFSISAPRTVDITLNYTIADMKGKILWKESEVRAVKDRLDFKKEFKLPELEPGSYILGVQAIYYASIGSSTAMFTVLPYPEEEKIELPPVAELVKKAVKPYLLVMGSFIATFILVGLIYIVISGRRTRRRIYMLTLIQDCREGIIKKDYSGAALIYEEIRRVYDKLGEGDREQFYEKIIGCYNRLANAKK